MTRQTLSFRNRVQSSYSSYIPDSVQITSLTVKPDARRGQAEGTRFVGDWKRAHKRDRRLPAAVTVTVTVTVTVAVAAAAAVAAVVAVAAAVASPYGPYGPTDLRTRCGCWLRIRSRVKCVPTNARAESKSILAIYPHASRLTPHSTQRISLSAYQHTNVSRPKL